MRERVVFAVCGTFDVEECRSLFPASTHGWRQREGLGLRSGKIGDRANVKHVSEEGKYG